MDSTADYVAAVATAVTEQMQSAGHTQLSVSEQTGIPRTTLARRLAGLTPFTVGELGLIAAALDVPVQTLVDPKRAVA